MGKSMGNLSGNPSNSSLPELPPRDPSPAAFDRRKFLKRALSGFVLLSAFSAIDLFYAIGSALASGAITVCDSGDCCFHQGSWHNGCGRSRMACLSSGRVHIGAFSPNYVCFCGCDYHPKRKETYCVRAYAYDDFDGWCNQEILQ